MNCQEFQELITPAVDQRLERDEMHAFERHAALCPACRREFEMELATKTLVRSKLKMVKTPPAVIASIREQIRRQPVTPSVPLRVARSAAPAPRRSGARRFLFLRSAGAFLITAVAVILLLSQEPADSVAPANNLRDDVIAQSLTNYHAVLNGDITPQVVSDRPEQVQRFFSGKTSFPVHVPSVRQYVLVGGVLNDYSGATLAHLVYRNDRDILYVYQADWNMVRSGAPLHLSASVKNELIDNGWFMDQRPGGAAIVLWTRGTTLCAAVANMNPADLLSRITEQRTDTAR